MAWAVQKDAPRDLGEALRERLKVNRKLRAVIRIATQQSLAHSAGQGIGKSLPLREVSNAERLELSEQCRTAGG